MIYAFVLAGLSQPRIHGEAGSARPANSPRSQPLRDTVLTMSATRNKPPARRRTPAKPDLAVVDGISVEVIRKRVKNLNLAVYPPDGRVRLTVPYGTASATAEAIIRQRGPWIQRQQERFLALPRPDRPLHVSGELHYLAGEPYRLELRSGSRPSVKLVGGALLLTCHSTADGTARERQLSEFYRAHLKAVLPPLIAEWESRLATRVAQFGVRSMKTRWGSCNPRAARIWLNLALAQRRPGLLEYVVVHEMVHLHVPNHGPDFIALMTRHLPNWRQLKAELDSWPLWSHLPASAEQFPFARG